MADRVGILGGTFDPVHYGHLSAAREAVQVLKLDRLILVPAGDPWQKKAAVSASGEDRYAMALLATATDESLDASRIEIDREGPSYTIDTLRELSGDPGFAGSQFYFVTGADALSGLPTWREYPELLELATFVGVTRPGHELDAQLPQSGGRIKLVTIPGVEVSSTLIRRRLLDGMSVDDLTTPEVVSYIRKRGLYSQVAL